MKVYNKKLQELYDFHFDDFDIENFKISYKIGILLKLKFIIAKYEAIFKRRLRDLRLKGLS